MEPHICPHCGSNKISRHRTERPVIIFSWLDWFDEEGIYYCTVCGSKFEVKNKNGELVIK